METNRLEAFSDGVLAIIITISVLGMKMPSGTAIKDLVSIIPQVLIYAMSFVYVGAYWNNHHHLMQTFHFVNAKILWANLFFLFWISMIPFMTNWMSENINAWVPTFGYGIILLMTAIGYFVLQHAILKSEKDCDVLKKSVQAGKWKGIVTGGLYVAALVIAAYSPHVSQVIYALLLCLWFVPDKRIEKTIIDAKLEE